MKKIFFIVSLFFIGIFSIASTAQTTASNSLSSNMLTQPKNDYEPGKDNDPEGRKDVGAIIYCVITPEYGVQFDVPIFGITNYEIWDENENLCIASYLEEANFVNKLFSLSEGNYLIKFETVECIYSGIVFINL